VLDELDPLHGLRDRAHEQEAAHLAVGDHVDAGALLLRDHLIDRAILDALEVARGEPTLLECGARLLQVPRAEHRSDHLGTKHAASSGRGGREHISPLGLGARIQRVISSQRLDLVPMPRAVLAALLEGRRDDAVIGAKIPAWWPEESDRRFLRVRIEDIDRDPAAEPWLLWALVHRGSARTMVGYAGFHGPPAGEDAKLELGYAIFPAFQGRGYASEAARALMDWARAGHGIGHFVVSIAPGNEPSLALARRLGFVQTGEQWDDEDGLELVFELRTGS
jgi:RimJ/RimL family protein N-acetyltransferase